MAEFIFNFTFHTYYGASWQISAQGLSFTWLKFNSNILIEEKNILLSQGEVADFVKACESLGLFSWETHYLHCCMLDGANWTLTLQAGDRTIRSSGTNGYPPGWADFCSALHKFSGLDINPCKTTT